jgi:hypothetical protein
MVTKITMITDPDCINCAVMEKVMEEYCAGNNPVIEFNIIKGEDIQPDFRPLSYPTFRLYEDQTHSVLRVSCTGLEPIKRHITEFQDYIEENF